MKEWINNISIKNKLISIVILTVTVVILFVFSYLSYKEMKMLETNLTQNTESVAEMFSKLSDYALEFNQQYNAQEALKPIKSYEFIVAGQIINHKNEIFATYSKSSLLIKHITIPHSDSTYMDGNFLHVYKPVVKDNQFLGMVYVRASIETLKAQKSDYQRTILILFVLVICFALLLALLLENTVLAPLHQLITATKYITETNNYKIDLKPKFGDEIGQLFNSFSQMIEKISQRESERDAALLDLQHSKESFKNISEASFDSIILTDAKGLIIYWNKAAQRIFGYKPNDIINESIGILLPERLRAKFYASFDTLQKKGEWRFIGKLFEFVGYSKRGYEFPIELTISKVGHGESLSLSFTIKDISQRKEYERSLIEARNKAEESDKLKSAFLANMSHEIRTPMNSIIGFSELLGKPNIREEEKNKFINYIISSGKSLLNLIDDIIDISKIEAGQLKINKVSVNVNSLLSEIFASFYENPKVKKNNFDLVLKREFNDHKFSLLTDPYRIKQILINLLTNAFKFTDEGSIEFGYRVCNTEFVEFYVKDTGVGIPVGKQDIIFDRFGQIEDTYFKNQGGTGLGLGISKKLTEMLGGKMWVESDSGQGATFYFTLPYTTSTGVRMLPPQKSSGKIKESWFHKTVLIAEDEESNFMFLEELLKPTGIGILHAKNGREAIEFVKEKTEIDIVLMDIKMPEMDGYQATRIIKTINNNLPVIAQTAYAMADEEQKTYAAGCDGYITKPISFTTLLDMMERLMQK